MSCDGEGGREGCALVCVCGNEKYLVCFPVNSVVMTPIVCSFNC